jgi:hypothetical protein
MRMDQDAFRQTYKAVNECFCAFEKSLLTNQCHCSCAERFCIAEREGVHCLSKTSQERCVFALQLLREQARFALRDNAEQSLLPHGKAIRIQVGGMRGVQAVLQESTENPHEVGDINGLLERAEQKFGNLEGLPFSEIMPSIAAYQTKTRRRKHR